MSRTTKSVPRIKQKSKGLKVSDTPKGGAMIRRKSTARGPLSKPVSAEQENTFVGLLRQAMTDRLPIEYIQALIAERNKEIARLAEIDFNKAHREFLKLCPAIVKNKHVNFKHKVQNPNDQPGETDYWYSELAHVIETIKDAEYQCGFSHDWRTTYEGNEIHITCIVKHVSGHSQSDTMKSNADSSGKKSAIQANASAVSYLRRYSLMGVLGLSARGDDNDGRKAKGEHVQDYDGKDQWAMLEKPTVQQFNACVDKVAKGEATLHDIQLIYRLTDEQEETLKHAAS